MSKLYYLDNTSSDLTDGGLFNNKLLEASPGTSTITVSLTGNQTRTAFAYTEPGDPGVTGATGDYSFAIQVTSGNVQGRVSFRVNRINSSGTVQSSSGATAESTTNPAGIITASLTNINLGAWSSGDRLRLDYIFRNNNNMNQSFSISTGLNTSVNAPFLGKARYFFFS